MQRLQISLKNGQTLGVDDPAETNLKVPGFEHFISAFRVSDPRRPEVYEFPGIPIWIRMSEVVAVSVVSVDPAVVQTNEDTEVKRRGQRKISGKNVT